MIFSGARPLLLNFVADESLSLYSMQAENRLQSAINNNARL